MMIPDSLEQREKELAADARRWLDENPLFLDVETTDLDGEILEIAIIDQAGSVLLDTLVKPRGKISPDAQRMHRISAEMVAQAPSFAELGPRVSALLQGRTVFAHNCRFDREMLEKGFARSRQGMPEIEWGCTMHCLTDLNDGRWPTLARAVDLSGAYRFGGLGDAHRAKADAEACRRIVVALATEENAAIRAWRPPVLAEE